MYLAFLKFIPPLLEIDESKYCSLNVADCQLKAARTYTQSFLDQCYPSDMVTSCVRAIVRGSLLCIHPGDFCLQGALVSSQAPEVKHGRQTSSVKPSTIQDPQPSPNQEPLPRNRANPKKAWIPLVVLLVPTWGGGLEF